MWAAQTGERHTSLPSEAIVTSLEARAGSYNFEPDTQEGIQPVQVHMTLVQCRSVNGRTVEVCELLAGCRNSTVFLPHSPGNIADISAQIRNGFLQGTIGAPPPPTMER